MGSLKPQRDTQIVQDDFHLATAADIVAEPSAPNAFVEGIMEGKEWVWDNGSLHEVRIREYKEQIDNSTRAEREDMKLNAFQDFLSRL